jgi:hypothetical protein
MVEDAEDSRADPRGIMGRILSIAAQKNPGDPHIQNKITEALDILSTLPSQQRGGPTDLPLPGTYSTTAPSLHQIQHGQEQGLLPDVRDTINPGDSPKGVNPEIPENRELPDLAIARNLSEQETDSAAPALQDAGIQISSPELRMAGVKNEKEERFITLRASEKEEGVEKDSKLAELLLSYQNAEESEKEEKLSAIRDYLVEKAEEESLAFEELTLLAGIYTSQINNISSSDGKSVKQLENILLANLSEEAREIYQKYNLIAIGSEEFLAKVRELIDIYGIDEIMKRSGRELVLVEADLLKVIDLPAFGNISDWLIYLNQDIIDMFKKIAKKLFEKQDKAGRKFRLVTPKKMPLRQFLIIFTSLSLFSCVFGHAVSLAYLEWKKQEVYLTK